MFCFILLSFAFRSCFKRWSGGAYPGLVAMSFKIGRIKLYIEIGGSAEYLVIKKEIENKNYEDKKTKE